MFPISHTHPIFSLPFLYTLTKKHKRLDIKAGSSQEEYEPSDVMSNDCTSDYTLLPRRQIQFAVCDCNYLTKSGAELFNPVYTVSTGGVQPNDTTWRSAGWGMWSPRPVTGIALLNLTAICEPIV
jgi:hypothetical protein